MPLTTEELLIPRYKVTARYPGSPYKVGDTLIDDGKNVILNQDGIPQFPLEFGIYPHIFRPMEWYEEREVEQLPKYAKWEHAEDGFVDEVWHWAVKDHSGVYCKTKATDFITFPGESRLLPATEQEYIDYQNSLKK